MTIHVNIWTVIMAKHDSRMLICMSPFRINLNVDGPTALCQNGHHPKIWTVGGEGVGGCS